jgi:bifunctional non-homologous end joining protein LigD
VALEQYRAKRDFSRTAEPRGKRARGERHGFVVQKHAARRLHYDFRLELDGVLLSWAVPKGPSFDPGTKRLAVQTEDHPVEYGGFEGIIPEGEYGAGAVIVWDRGRWIPEGDPHAGLKKGHLVFRLEGERLRGRWHLVKTRGAGRERDRGKSWLLFKGDDELASAYSEVVERFESSVVSGRTIEEVRSDPDRRWHGKHGDGAREGQAPSKLEGARAAALPPFVEPELATLVDAAPEGKDWLHEIKLDGYRMLARLEQGTARLLTRRGNDWTERVPTVARALAALPLEQALIDGELVVLDQRGISDFQALQNALNAGGDAVCTYCAFDLLHLDGFDLARAPLLERRQLLADLLARAGISQARLRLSGHVLGSGPDFLQRACELGLEGIVSKRASAPYRSGRGRDWLKSKCLQRQELVVGGFSNPSGSRSRFGALLVGAYDDQRQLRYRGKVGTGFSERALAEIHARLLPLEQARAAFADPPRGADARGVHWVRPELVAEVAYTELTSDGMLRHPRFIALRDDKPAGEVELERPRTSKRAASKRTTKRAAAKRPQAAGRPPSKLRLTNPDRVLYPNDGITKRELAEFYATIADHVLPHVVDRPLTLVRCPEGHEKECFYQKHTSQGMPDVIRNVPIEEDGKLEQYMAIDDLEGLLALVQFGALELHVSGARTGDLDRPDRLVFDLDPDPALAWVRVEEAAISVRERLAELGLESWVKTTGGKGLHVVCPIAPTLDFDVAKAFCKAIADDMVAREPRRYVATVSKARRAGKIFIDYLRNSSGATAVAAFSTRARSGAPVSTPIAWDELASGIRSEHFTIRNLPQRLSALRGDPWHGFLRCRQKIDRAALRALRVER